MKISDEFLAMLGAIFLLILAVFLQGVLIYGVINGFCWLFNIQFHVSLLKALVLGVLLSIIIHLQRKKV